MFFAIPKSIYISQDRINGLKQCSSLHVYLQYEIVILSAVTKVVTLYLAFNNRVCWNKDEMNQITVWSTITIPIVSTNSAREHYKNAFFCDLTIWPTLDLWPVFLKAFLTLAWWTCVMQQTIMTHHLWSCWELISSTWYVFFFCRIYFAKASRGQDIAMKQNGGRAQHKWDNKSRHLGFHLYFAHNIYSWNNNKNITWNLVDVFLNTLL